MLHKHREEEVNSAWDSKMASKRIMDLMNLMKGFLPVQAYFI